MTRMMGLAQAKSRTRARKLPLKSTMSTCIRVVSEQMVQLNLENKVSSDIVAEMLWQIQLIIGYN
jgi:hypothetical protein